MKTRLIALFTALILSASAAAYTFTEPAGADAQGSHPDEVTSEAEEEKAGEAASDGAQAGEADTDGTQADGDATDGTQAGEAADADGGIVDEGPFTGRPSFRDGYPVSLADFRYKVFTDVMDLYLNEHLYDFSRDELLEKFLYDLVNKHPEQMEYLINTMLGTMDPYSAYHEASSGFLSNGSTNGYGIVVEDRDGGVYIRRVMKGTSAEAAGLAAGDRILRVNGLEMARLPWSALSRVLRTPYVFFSVPGEKGTYEDYNPPVTLTVLRGGEEKAVTMVKGPMENEVLESVFDEDKQILTVSIASFVGETLADDFKALIEDYYAKGVRKLTVDLRGNGGGSLMLVLNMAEIFVKPDDVMCYMYTKGGGEPQAIVSEGKGLPFDSISVLVDEGTASAAELMASVLRVKAGARLIGHTTFGKAVGQTVYPLVTGDNITVTTYGMLDANGEDYNGIGLVPDIEMDNVELLYRFPKVAVFNHVNYKEIVPGVYSEACLAYEQRLAILELLREEDVDGIWDESTRAATVIFQGVYCRGGDTAPGVLDDRSVTVMTNVINGYKDKTYLEDSQAEAAALNHSSFDQARRLSKEKERLAQKEEKLIAEARAALEAFYDEEEARGA